MENNKYLSVSALNKYIAYKFETDINLGMVYIKGELSNIRFSKGYLYFVLKDPESEISCIMFANSISKLLFEPKDGMKVYIKGKVAVYQKKGNYNLTAFEMTEYGIGDLYQKFLFLKDKLSKEGLFDEAHKKPIPQYSEKIGVITSETADAFQDIKSTIFLRYPIATIYLYPALVQGNDAPKSLIRALKKANKDNICDVLIIARGGGSVEDLFCFNDEELAREIYNSKIPIISGVGHETDFTICDFVSDERAPTPTGAAVKATKNQTAIISEIDNLQRSMVIFYKRILENKFYNYQNIVSNHYFNNFQLTINDKIKEVDVLTDKLNSLSPTTIIERNEKEVNNLIHRLNMVNLKKLLFDYNEKINLSINSINNSFLSILDNYDHIVSEAINKLILLNPLSIMQKGYTLTYQNSKLIYSIDEIDVDKDINVVFIDGNVEAKITKINKGEK